MSWCHHCKVSEFGQVVFFCKSTVVVDLSFTVRLIHINQYSNGATYAILNT